MLHTSSSFALLAAAPRGDRAAAHKDHQLDPLDLMETSVAMEFDKVARKTTLAPVGTAREEHVPLTRAGRANAVLVVREDLPSMESLDGSSDSSFDDSSVAAGAPEPDE